MLKKSTVLSNEIKEILQRCRDDLGYLFNNEKNIWSAKRIADEMSRLFPNRRITQREALRFLQDGPKGPQLNKSEIIKLNVFAADARFKYDREVEGIALFNHAPEASSDFLTAAQKDFDPVQKIEEILKQNPELKQYVIKQAQKEMLSRPRFDPIIPNVLLIPVFLNEEQRAVWDVINIKRVVEAARESATEITRSIISDEIRRINFGQESLQPR